jgi:uncharacterized membrane protein YedE/YeeE
MMNRNLAALIAGILFGIGLAVSQMVSPAKVLGFLDLFGRWDPSLAFVMAGALAVALVGFRLIEARTAPVFAERFEKPARRDLDARLIVGAAIFGVGWGLAGYCPGPAIASLAFGMPEAVIVVLAMAIGAWIQRMGDRPAAVSPAAR